MSKKRTKSIPNRLYYSLQVSLLPSAQLSPRSISNPRVCLSTAKRNIQLLAKQVKKCKQEHENLINMEGQARDNGEMLEEKVEVLRKQLELVLQQNATLTVAKRELKEEIREIKLNKSSIEKAKEELKKNYKKQLKRLLIKTRLDNNKHRKDINDLNTKLKKQKELSLSTHERIKLVNTELKVLEQKKYRRTIATSKEDKEITRKINLLSYTIEST